jgi:hypothetical protein
MPCCGTRHVRWSSFRTPEDLREEERQDDVTEPKQMLELSDRRDIMQHVREWPIRLYFFEEDGQTQARVSLKTEAGTLEKVGEALCEPGDFDVPEIGDEVAAGRALIALGTKLLRSGEADIEDVEGRQVHIEP